MELLKEWYSGKQALEVLKDIRDLKNSKISCELAGFLIKALKDQKVLPTDFHIYWIRWGLDFKNNDHRIFNSKEEASLFAYNGPFEPSDSDMLFQPYRIVTEEEE